MRVRSAGQSLAEYLACCAVLVSALLLPVGEEGPVLLQWAQLIGQRLHWLMWLLALS